MRDIGQFIGVVVTAMMFLSPIFYPITSLPAKYQAWMLLNPLTIPALLARDFLFWGFPPNLNLGLLLGYSVVALAVAFFGFFWFQKTRKGFADVL